MDSRLFFVLGDLAGNILVGLFVGWLCWAIVGTGWNMFFTMLLTMAAGMIVGLVLLFPVGILFGAMEVMLPLMFTGMASGMVVGMWCTMAPISAATAAFCGAICSVPRPVDGLRQLRRVLKPGGELFMFEHTGSSYYPFKAMMNLMTILTSKIGPDMNRTTVANVKEAGFQLLEVNNLFLDVVKIIKAVNPRE